VTNILGISDGTTWGKLAHLLPAMAIFEGNTAEVFQLFLSGSESAVAGGALPFVARDATGRGQDTVCQDSIG